jgi:hypothetical protein
MRDIEIPRAATSRKTLTLMHWYVRVQSHMHHANLAPQECRGGGVDGTVNPTKFLQIYSISILVVGGDEVIMANYFPVTLTGTTCSWLMNLPVGTLDSWLDLCRQFTANLESAYAQSGNETDLHAIQQQPGESLCSFIQWFSQTCNTIPCISNAYIVVAFHQGMRDEKMLEELATHDI